MPAPPEIQTDLLHETNARFWSQTGYRVGRQLDKTNPLDAKMLPVWANIYNKILAEYRAGTVKWTYKHPRVATALATASHANASMVAHIDAAHQAAAQGAHAAAVDLLRDAEIAHRAGQLAASDAASYQPFSVSHAHLRNAVHHILYFHMNGGQGVYDGSNDGFDPNAAGPGPASNTNVASAGSDTAAVMQASAATATATAAANAATETSAAQSDEPAPGSIPGGKDPTTIYDHGTSHTARNVAIGAGFIALVGLGIYAAKR